MRAFVEASADEFEDDSKPWLTPDSITGYRPIQINWVMPDPEVVHCHNLRAAGSSTNVTN